MKTKLLALTLAALLLIPSLAVEAAPAAEIAPCFSSLYATSGMTFEKDAPISRAAFAMLTFEAFRNINSGVFPQLSANNVFTDLGSAPEDIYVLLLYGIGVVNGVSETSFAPRRAITREEAATMLARARIRQNPALATELEAAKTAFTAVPDAASVSEWAKESAAYIYSLDILPLKDGNFDPKAELTTEEAMLLCSGFIAA